MGAPSLQPVDITDESGILQQCGSLATYELPCYASVQYPAYDMTSKDRCELCGLLIRPVKTAISEVAAVAASALVACGPEGCSLGERIGRGIVAGGLTWGLGKAIEIGVQEICQCSVSEVT